ncbi:unnamed protein product [Cuscuta epithymum]|uniref:FAR1 domain-containing protein n=1 Tax=Cuscuta epithymum TaxID=186058 RepID=A0AAV0F2N5_9ASTE|nr:unnamed protein product [Cuscuta epithymum]
MYYNTSNSACSSKWKYYNTSNSTCGRPYQHVGASSPTKRCRVSNRIGCKVRISFNFCGRRGYSIFGFEERHNHPMSSDLVKPILKVNRSLDIGHQKFILNCAKANISTMKCYKLFKDSVRGYSNIGAMSVDFKIFKKDLKTYIAGVDAQMRMTSD